MTRAVSNLWQTFWAYKLSRSHSKSRIRAWADALIWLDAERQANRDGYERPFKPSVIIKIFDPTVEPFFKDGTFENSDLTL